MHYIPASKDEDTTGTSSKDSTSRGRRKSRGNDSRRSSRSNRRRRKTRPMEATPPSTKSTHQKAAKKLRSFITRTFAKHKPQPLNTNLSEQDALLTVIHCAPQHNPNNDPETPDSHSYYSAVSNSNTPPAQQQWQRLRQSMQVPPMEDSSVDTYSLEETPEERAHRIQKAQDEIRQSMSFPLWQCLLAIGIYIALTVVLFSYWLEEDWSLLESSYFAVVTFTTIGYGDVVPDTRYARLFTCVWALSGVACLGIALGVLGSNLIVVHEQHMEKAQVQRQSRVIGLFDHHYEQLEEGDAGSDPTTYSTIEEGRKRTMFDGMYDSEDENNPRAGISAQAKESAWRQFTATLIRWTLLGGYIAGILYLIGQKEGWNVTKTIYYGIITASTVGYGDFCPHTDIGRFLSILFIPVAVGIMGCFLEKVANAIIQYRREQYTNKLHNKPLTLETIRILDSDGDGEVTMLEFVEFMLVAMGQIDRELMQQLKEHFHRLDVDGSGTINKADLAQMAKQRLNNQNAAEKLQLAKYKDYLLEHQTAHGSKPESSTSCYSTSTNEDALARPALERRTTKQTSNRSALTNQTSPSTFSYQTAPTTY